jgi:hypothetical protein
MRSLRRLLGPVLAALSVMGAALPARAGTTIDFDFKDRRYILPWQKHGGRVYVPDRVGTAPVPLIVFLHGTNNKERSLHPWMNDGENDLRPMLDDLIDGERITPALLAAPSQTRDADMWHLWKRFDIDAFVKQTQRVLGDRARIDSNRVILVGHSGAGCNPAGGILDAARSRSTITLFALTAIDVCMDRMSARYLGRADSRTAVDVFWQMTSWHRNYDGFREEILERRGSSLAPTTLQEVSDLVGEAHTAIVPPALSSSLLRLLPTSPPSSAVAIE